MKRLSCLPLLGMVLLGRKLPRGIGTVQHPPPRDRLSAGTVSKMKIPDRSNSAGENLFSLSALGYWQPPLRRVNYDRIPP